jgi:uncharacterized protein YecT (DUF1311 family)
MACNLQVLKHLVVRTLGCRDLNMHSLRNFLLVATLFVAKGMLCPDPAHGQSDCGSATTTASMQTCAIARYRAADRELTDVVAQLNRKLDTKGRHRLYSAQLAWVRFRDANADFLADVARGGTLAPVLRVIALADMTEARSRELKKTLQP